MTIAELGRRMSSAEFTEWLAFSELEPFGPAREDTRAGVVAAVVANSVRNPKVHSEPFMPAALFAAFPWEAIAEPVEPSPAVLQSKILAWAASTRVPRQRVVQKPVD